jgi:hypothetical protein
MTVVDVPRSPATAVVTPESQNLDNLRAMLDDPDLAGFREEIQAAIVKLTATSVLGA